VRSLTPPGAVDTSPALQAIAEHSLPVIVIGEVAGALQGWPLVLTGTGVVEVCGNPDEVGPALTDAGFDDVNGLYALATGQAVSVTTQPPGTHGPADLGRGADAVIVQGGAIRVAGVLDLLRIAEASVPGERTRDVLAYQALLEVKRAQQLRLKRTTDEERLQRWLSQQTPEG
jgi:hypothetical protein